jgi:hypothetical protein
MYINPQSWHARLFFMSLEVWSKFKTGYHHAPSRYKKGTNICFYIRTITVWMPLVLLSHILIAAGFVYVVFIYPVNAFGFQDYFTTIAIITGITIGACSILLGVLWCTDTIANKIKDLSRREVRDGLTARDIVLEWIESKTSNICKFVTFERRDATNA